MPSDHLNDVPQVPDELARKLRHREPTDEEQRQLLRLQGLIRQKRTEADRTRPEVIVPEEPTDPDAFS